MAQDGKFRGVSADPNLQMYPSLAILWFKSNWEGHRRWENLGLYFFALQNENFIAFSVLFRLVHGDVLLCIF